MRPAEVWLEDDHAAVCAVEIPRPPVADVVVEGVRLVLGQDGHIVQPGIDTVAEGEVDDAILAGAGSRRLWALER
jgi:hypothetical protein